MIYRTHTLLALGLCTLPTVVLAEGGSPWLPIPGQTAISVSQTQQSGDSAYIGSTKLPIAGITGGGAKNYRRSTTGFSLGYGISDSLALDAAISYANVKVGIADSDSGLNDTTLGLRYRVLDEYEGNGLPTVTLRGGAIIKGNYDGARLASIGKGANGFDFSVLVGKQVTPAFSLQGELGLQTRSKSVPTATYYDITGRYRLGGGFAASAGYNSKSYGGNLDIGGVGFTPARFQQVREERAGFRFGLGYSIARNQSLDLIYGKTSSGRNTVKDDSSIRLAYTIGL